MGRVHAKPKQYFLGWCFKSAFLPTYRYVFALMPQSQACVKVFELCCSNLHKSCRNGLRLEHQALEKEGCKQRGLLLWPAISCILLSGPVVFFFPTCCVYAGCKYFQAEPLAVCVCVSELLSQLETLGLPQRQEHEWMVGTRWLGTAMSDAASLGGCS